MIENHTMTEEQFAVFLPAMTEDYAQNIAANTGIPIFDARNDATEEMISLLPDGRLTLNHFFYRA